MRPYDVAYSAELRRLRHVRAEEVYAYLEAEDRHSVTLHLALGNHRHRSTAASSVYDDARRDVVEDASAWLRTIRDREIGITSELAYAVFARGVAEVTTIAAFGSEAPSGWFDDPQVLGIDFEGSPPALVQIACTCGVVVHALRTPWVRRILRDRRHLHAVFGRHDLRMVRNGWDVQTSVGHAHHPVHTNHIWSLVDAYSLVCRPDLRLHKDKTIHKRVNWKEAASAHRLTSEALEYAVSDAWMTLHVAWKMYVGRSY